jgi:endonuclease/exonuclease/phosphatase family metal-dependent hydrolase
MTGAEADANIAGLIGLINEVEPDVLLGQEVEVNSKRTAYRDMVQMILDGTKLNYAAFIPVWKARFIAEQGLGRMESGIVVFSRYPITENLRIAQRDRNDQSELVRTFYLHRGIGQATIDVGGGRLVTVVNVHTAAYDNDGANGDHLVQIKSVVDALTGSFLVGGDFNAIPPGTQEHEGFDDEEPVPDDTAFQGAPYDLAAMQPFFDSFKAHMPLVAYKAGDVELQRRWYTHTVAPPMDDQGLPHFWNRALDYLFTNTQFVDENGDEGFGEVLQQPGHGVRFTPSDDGIAGDPMTLSDHAPVVATWRLQ